MTRLARSGQRGVLARPEPSWPGSVPAAARSQVVRHSGLPRLPGTRWARPRVQPEAPRTSGQGGESRTHPSVSLATHLSSHWVAGSGFATDSLPGPGGGLSPEPQGRAPLTSLSRPCLALAEPRPWKGLRARLVQPPRPSQGPPVCSLCCPMPSLLSAL